MSELKLYMLLLGCTPKGRHTEQHDIFFGIGTGLKELIPAMHEFWPEAQGKLHIDAWREVTKVSNHEIRVVPKESAAVVSVSPKLFFLNLGGYKENEFEEFHYKMLVVSSSLDDAKAQAKKTAFFKHTSLKSSPTSLVATSHIDDKYGIDVDDVYNVEDILPQTIKSNYSLRVIPSETPGEDDVYLGYLKLADITK